MFLDTFMNVSESSIPDLNDLQLECAVSLEAAYNDMVLESCQLKYQAMVEGVSVIHEGVIESIKNFFKAIFNAIKKFFGGDSSGGGGGGSTSRNIAMLKKQLKDKRVKEGMEYLHNHPDLLDKFKIPDGDTIVKIQSDDISRGLKDAIEFANKIVKTADPNSKVVMNADQIALETLRFFIKSAFVKYHPITSAKIDSLADFKKALLDHTKLKTFSDLGLDEFESYQEVIDSLDELNRVMQKQKNIVLTQMEEFKKNVINQVPKEYASIACKVAKTLTNASMIYCSYSCHVSNQTAQVARQVFDMAIKINTKQ